LLDENLNSCYGLEIGQWTEKYPMKIRRHFASSVAMPNSSEVYIIGGEVDTSKVI